MGTVNDAELRFTALYDTHAQAVSSYLARRLPAPDRGDALAEVFTVLWRKIDDVPDKARPWLFGIARKVAANQVRAGGRASRLRQHLAAQPSPAAGDFVDASNTATDLARAFEELRESDREVLRLLAWDGLSVSDAAQALRCSSAAVVTRLHRARRRLRRHLGAEAHATEVAPAPHQPTTRPPRTMP